MGGSGGSGGFDPGGSCESTPIGFWTFDDCNTTRTDLADSSFQGHSAFRTVPLSCAPGQTGQAAAFKALGDLVYAPDQPDFSLDEGVTIAAWVKPDRVDGVSTIFRKRDDANSALTLVIKDRSFQFVLKLASGRIVSISTPATANAWTHIAATYDGRVLRLYKDGQQVKQATALGKIANGRGPLLMGNDIAERRFRGLMDDAWFNTLAAPAETILALTCLRAAPTLGVTPVAAPPVPSGTSVAYQLSLTSNDSRSCAPRSAFGFVNLPPELTATNPFLPLPAVRGGETVTAVVDVSSIDDAEPGTYPVRFDVFDGNASVSAEASYSVAQPTGCFVRKDRELMIRDLSVVEDPIRTTFAGPATDARTGAWTFGRLARQFAPSAAAAPDMVEKLFSTWLTDQTVNGFSVPARPAMQQLVLDSWPRTANGKLDLNRAPLRLLAIVNRPDLRDLANGKAGEGRFVFGVLDAFGNQTQFTVILEYRLPARTTADVTAWAQRWHNLQSLPFPSEAYNAALQDITQRFAKRDAEPTRPNGSALAQLRTNEIALSFVWELREFHLSQTSGMLVEVPVERTPDTSFIQESPVLADFVNRNEAAILTETHVVPSSSGGAPFLAGSSFNNLIAWRSADIKNNEARHKFSLNTCNGCHSSEETGTPFLQVSPRDVGGVAGLSGFLTGITLPDPVTGQLRTLNDLKRRKLDLEGIVCPAPARTAARQAVADSSGAALRDREAFLSKGIDRAH